MKILLKTNIKNMMEKKARTIVIILTIAIVTSTLYLNLAVSGIVQQKYSEYNSSKYGKVTFIVTRITNQPLFDEDSLGETFHQFSSVPELTGYGVYDPGQNDKIGINIHGISAVDAQSLNLMSIENVGAAADLGKDEVIVGEKFSSVYHLSKGDELTVTIGNEPVSFRIAAISSNKGFFYNENSRYNIVMNLKDLQTHAGLNGKISVLYYQDSGPNATSFFKQLQHDNSEFTVTDIATVTNSDILDSMFQAILLIALVVVVIISVIVIVSLFKHILAERLPVIGTFRSLGVTRTKTTFILLLEAFLYGLFGTLIGLISGIISLKPLLIAFRLAESDKTSLLHCLSVKSLIITAFVGIALMMISVLSRIIKTSKRSLKDTIFDTVQTEKGYRKRGCIFALIIVVVGILLYPAANYAVRAISLCLLAVGAILLIPYILTLISMILNHAAEKPIGLLYYAGKNLRGNKVVISASRTTSVILILAIIIFSMIVSVNAFFESSMSAYNIDYVVEVYSMNDKLRNIDSLRGVEASFDNYVESGDLLINGKSITMQMVPRAENDSFDTMINHTIVYHSADSATPPKGSIILDEYLLRKYDLKTGDTVLIKTGKSEKSFTVYGTMDCYRYSMLRNIVMLNNEDFRTLYSTAFPKYIFVKVNNEFNEKELTDYLDDTNSDVLTISEFVGEQQESTSNMLGIIKIALLIGVGMSIFSIVNNLWISYKSRRKEFAIQKSLAFSSNQLSGMLFIEALIQAVVACLVSGILSIVIVTNLSFCLEGIGLPIKMLYAKNDSLLLLVASFIAIILTAFIPFVQVHKMKIVEEIKYE